MHDLILAFAGLAASIMLGVGIGCLIVRSRDRLDRRRARMVRSFNRAHRGAGLTGEFREMSR